jgi:threonine dehydrogenase-like Zn-dependent dehydrogenase
MCEKSDLHVYRGIEPSPPGPIMGHEFMGEIVEVGSAVTNLRKGDRVVSAFTTSWYVYPAVLKQWNSNRCW